MNNAKRVRALFLDPLTPSGLRMICESWLGKRAAEVLEGRPEPPLSEFLVEHFDREAAAGLPDEMAWLLDPPIQDAPDTTDPMLPPELEFLNH